MPVVIPVEHLSKHNRHGLIGGGILREDLNRWWAKARGRPDPMLKIGQEDHGNCEGGEFWPLRDTSLSSQTSPTLMSLPNPVARRDLMHVSAIQYIADQHGQTTGVFIPIEVWKKIQEQLARNDTTAQPTAWDVLDSLAGSIAAPTDWAQEHDHYLYGTPKRESSGP
jgi:hypothetical protein